MGVAAKYFEEMQAGMSDAERAAFHTQYAEERKDRNAALVLSIFTGYLGVDRFYLGHVVLGLLKLLTAGGFGIWYIIDWFLIMGATDGYNRRAAWRVAERIRTQGAPPGPPPQSI